MFDESVRMRMIADVPLGAFLSGGIDSSSVVASMALQSPEPVKTFSIGFRRDGVTTSSNMPRRSPGAIRPTITTMMVRPDSVDLVPRLVWHFDEPFADSSAIPDFPVSQFAAQHVKVVLTGDGGDELFGGYPNVLALEGLRKFDAIPHAASGAPIRSRSRVAALSGLRQELPADDQPAFGARALFRVRTTRSTSQPEPARAGWMMPLEEPRPAPRIRRMPAARTRRHRVTRRCTSKRPPN